MHDFEVELTQTLENTLMHVCVSFFIVRFVLFNDENNGASSKDILHVTVKLIIRTRSKSFEDALNGLIHWILVDSNML